VSGLALAVRYLTIVPVRGGATRGLQGLGGAAAWFPVVGLGLGLALALVAALTARLFPPLLASLLTVTVWKLLTGGLHLDGLADCLDGLVGRDAEHRLAIMHDSRIGAFGAIGLILYLLLEIAAVSELTVPARWQALIAAPAIARAVPPLLGLLFPAARSEGMGAAFRAGLRRGAVAVALAIALAVALAALGWLGLVALAAALLAAAALGRFLASRLGGVTGDVLGAAVEISELVVLLVVSAWTYARP
jgi:adenosylcobinamide-GDP ribazoletransferase